MAAASHFLTRNRNPLLMKDDVGHAKPTYYDLPNDGFVYGKSESENSSIYCHRPISSFTGCFRGADPEGAKEITMTWKSHTPNALPETNVLDFRSLNKSAIDEGKCVNAHAQKVYREQHPKFLVHKSGSKKQHSGDATAATRHHQPMPANFIYGKKTRPSTPISYVISNQFGLESEMVVEARYEEMAEAEEKAKTHCQLKIKSTKAAKGHAAVGKSAHQKHVIGGSDQAELFKLSKFKTVPARCYLPKGVKKAGKPMPASSSCQGSIQNASPSVEAGSI